jgi:hypothetical protein
MSPEMSPENSRKLRSNFWNADGCGMPQTRLEFVGTVPKAKSSSTHLNRTPQRREESGAVHVKFCPMV